MKKLKILIAEDDEVSEMFLSMSVQKLSKEIIIAKSGTEAVEICRKIPDIDLALINIKMPEIAGYEFIRQIRRFNASIVIIAQTAFIQNIDRENAMLAGCNDYIAKPFGPSLLIALIKKHFKNQEKQL